jgi:HEAT repeat protein
MSGEPVDRLNFLFYELGMVEEDVRRLKDRRWWVRAQAARDLGLARARGAMAPLAEALEDPREDVRYEAMRALAASIGVEALPTILASHDRLSQWDAVELSVIVMQFREKAVPFLLDALQASSTEVVLFCLEMLAEIGFVEAVEPVRELARSYPNVLVRAKAMEVLGRLGDGRAESLLMREINNPFPGLRLSAIRALAQIGTPAAVEPLLLRLKSADIEEQVVIMTALVRSGEKGRTTVHALEAGDDPKLRAVAAHVLETAMA